MVTILAIILVSYMTMVRLDRTATHTYGQSLKAENIAQGGLNLVIGELQKEMAKDQAPEATYPEKPVFLNVSSTNILPQVMGGNAALPTLVKISSPTPAFTGSLLNGTLLASTVNSNTPSRNGRYITPARWSQVFLGTFPNAGATPNWIFMNRAGPTDLAGPVFGAGTDGAVNNSATTNSGYVLGRFAYAVYDEGSLLDITSAGYPSALITPDQLQEIKGTLASADLSGLGIDVKELVDWRNAATGKSGTGYIDYIKNTASVDGFTTVAAGDTTFLRRQDLIGAAKNHIAGLTTDMLPNLTTFTREHNAPGFKPAATIDTPAGNTIDYATLANTATSINPLIPLVRHPKNATITSYKVDGSAYTYKVVAGDPLVSRRFPLDRLKWLGPKGPVEGGTAANVQACFGLKWNAATGIWQYVGASGSTLQTDVKKLADILTETTPREPNFFELIKAGVLSGSLALSGHPLAPATQVQTFSYNTQHEASLPLHILRLGANIISSYQSAPAPVVIEYDQSGGAWQASGIDNLPYLNTFSVLMGANSSSSLGTYLVIGLWNPNQGTFTGDRPPIRLRMSGSMMLGNNYGLYGDVQPFGNAALARKGYTINLDTTQELSTAAGKGVNGFVDPHAMYPADLKTAPGPGTGNGQGWAELPPIKVNGSDQVFAGYRVPDFKIDAARLSDSADLAAKADYWISAWSWFNMDAANPFNFWLEYQNPDGVWVPYTYHAGINDPATWFSKPVGMATGYLGRAYTSDTSAPLPAAIYQIDGTLAPDVPKTVAAIFYRRKNIWFNTDPRTLRFNYGQHATDVGVNWSRYLKGSIWSSETDPAQAAVGMAAQQVGQKIFGAPWAPGGLMRNNNPNFAPGVVTSQAAYKDPDGVQRLADSGLFTDVPSAGNSWAGDPYALSTTRVADRPVILNRPFNSVAELGYVSRDYPWRTFDLFTEKSADGGLLDMFTVSRSDKKVVAGRISLNTKNSLALNAIMNNTQADPINLTMMTKPSQVATKLLAATAGTPLASRGDLVTRGQAALTASEFTGDDEFKVKTRRESVVRALADVGQTRTWNLLIDIVAQAGKYPPNATSAAHFIVEGERRYWLHVAIDRMTGEVVDRQLEVVTQ